MRVEMRSSGVVTPSVDKQAPAMRAGMHALRRLPFSRAGPTSTPIHLPPSIYHRPSGSPVDARIT